MWDSYDMASRSGWKKDTDWYNKKANATAKVKHTCPKCGRKMIIAYKMEYTICDHCGTKIYKDKRIEFKDKLKQELKKSKEEN